MNDTTKALIKLPFIVLAPDDTLRRSTDQCDCACADASIPLPALDSFTVSESKTYWQVPDVMVTGLAREWYMAYQPLARQVPVVLNTAAFMLWRAFEDGQRLADVAGHLDMDEGKVAEGISLLVGRGLLELGATIHPRPQEASKQLTAWLHTTNACNLRCPYCYLHKTAEQMPLEVGLCALETVFTSAKRHGYSKVKLKYSGGEAMTNFSLVLQLQEYALKRAAEDRIELDAVVLSNGTLLNPNRIAQIRNHALRLMISLDGIGAAHDAQRTFADGRGSFELVQHSIELACDAGLVPDISITVSERNLDGLPDTVAFCLKRDLPFTLNFYRENDCSTSFADLQFGEQRMIQALLATYQVIEANLPRYSLLGSLIDRASFIAPHQHTCSVGRDYLVIDQSGRIAKCQMAIENVITDIYATDPLRIIQQDTRGIQNRSVDEKEGCRECEWRYWCAGGCPLATFRATGRYDIKSPNCNIYKTLYPHVLRLEALRLVREYTRGLDTCSVEQ